MKIPIRQPRKFMSAALGLFLGLAAHTASATITWWDPSGTTAVGGSGIWDTTSLSWSTNATGLQTNTLSAWIPTNAAGFCAGPAGSALQGTFVITVNSAINFAGIYNGSQAPAPCNVTFSGGGSLNLASGLQAFSTINGTGGSTTINVPITGPGTVNPQSSGSLYLYAANTYTGGTTLSGSGGVNFNNGSSFGTGPITWGISGSVIATPAAVAPFTIPNAVVPIAGSQIFVGVAAAPVTFSGNWTLPATGTVAWDVRPTGGITTISGNISGAANFNKYNLATLVLSGANTYTGKTTVSNGIVSVSSYNSVGTPVTSSSLGRPITVANGTIDLGGGTTGATNTYTGPGETTDRVVNLASTTGTDGLVANGTGAIVFTSDFTATGIGIKTLSLSGTNTAANKILGKIVNGAGTVSVNKTGAGSWTLAGANSYTGNTTNASASTLNFANALAMGPSGTFVINGNGFFDNTSGGPLTISNPMNLSGGSPTFLGTANLTMSGAVTLIAANRTITVTSNTLLLSSPIGQDATARNFTKAGNGTLTISATSTYAGATAVTAGKLKVDGDISSSSAVTVSTNATLSGGGIVPAVTLNNGSTIAPGTGPGTLTTGVETWAGGGNYVWEINDFSGSVGNNWDIITAASLNITATAATKFNVKLASLTAANVSGNADNFNSTADYDIVILHTTNGITGDVSTLNVDASAFSNTLDANGFFFLSVSGNDLVLSYRRAARISTQPAASTLVSSGGTVNLDVTATGSSTLIYQWKKGGVSLSNGVQVSGSTVSGATTPDLTITSAQYADAGSYTVSVANSSSSDTSTVAVVNVAELPVAGAVSPATDTRDAGQTAVFTVSATGGNLSYQWKKGVANLSDGVYENAAAVSGATSSSLTLASVRAADADTYTCVVNNTAGASTSSAATLAVNDPVITVPPPATLSADAGSTATLSVTAVGTTNLIYQWKKSGVNIDSSLNPSATNTTLTLSSVTDADAASYTVAVTNALGSGLLSSGTILSIIDPPIITNPSPATQSVAAGSNAVFSITLTSGTSPTYQWFDGSVQLSNGAHIAGATSTSLTVVNVQDADNGSYHIVVTNSLGGQTSTDGILTVVHAPAITNITTTVVDLTNVVFNAAVTGSPAVFQWSTNNVALTDGDHYAGTTTTNFTVINALAADAGSYTLTASNLAGISSVSATIAAPSFDSQPAAQTVDCLHPATFTAHATGTGIISYQWFAGTSLLNGETNTTLTLSSVTTASSGQSYTVVAGSTYGTTTSTAAVLTVSDTSAPVITLNGANPATAECHTSYTDAGATANDLCEGSVAVTVSGSVNVNAAGSYTLTYVATDSTGNSATNTRAVNIIDTTAPVVTLLGSNPYSMVAHTTFTDPGATANDTCAGNLTVTTTGTVDQDTAGSYTLTYLADDDNGNTNSATRVVNVSPASPKLFITMDGTDVVLSWSGAFTLQSATNFPATWLDIPGATSPYTTEATNMQSYYRLKY